MAYVTDRDHKDFILAFDRWLGCYQGTGVDVYRADPDAIRTTDEPIIAFLIRMADQNATMEQTFEAFATGEWRKA